MATVEFGSDSRVFVAVPESARGMADKGLEWVFDSLVEFLRGPIWNIPVLTFIEHKSVVFEPGAENEQELRKIHEAYKNLVDFMLGSYMEDLSITPEEFERSCSVATKKALNKFQQSLFQQVWAADDFEIFRRMMTQKNLELQLQALEFLTQKRGSVPHCMEGTDRQTNDPSDTILQERMSEEARREKELLEQAMRKTLLQPEATDGETDAPEDDRREQEPALLADDIREPSHCEPGNIESAMRKTLLQLEATEQTDRETEAPADDRREGEPADDTHCAEPDSIESPPIDACSLHIPNVLENKTLDNEPRASIPLQVPAAVPEQTKDDYLPKQEVSPAELQKRQEYLRQQRDRLLALKKAERARRLSEGAEGAQPGRPRSARAARRALEAAETVDVEATFRRSLAAKLRSEVIDKAG